MVYLYDIIELRNQYNSYPFGTFGRRVRSVRRVYLRRGRVPGRVPTSVVVVKTVLSTSVESPNTVRPTHPFYTSDV